MKLIKINHVTQANKRSVYKREKLNKICLGNGLNCYFSDYKKLMKFLAETNKMLNLAAQELNRIYIEIWTEQRKVYLTYHMVFSRSMKLKDCYNQTERNFNLLCTRSDWTNGNHFSFNYFTNIIEILFQWVDEILNLMKSKNLYSNIDTFGTIKERIKYIENKIMTWGKEYTNAPPCPYDNSHKVALSGVDDKAVGLKMKERDKVSKGVLRQKAQQP